MDLNEKIHSQHLWYLCDDLKWIKKSFPKMIQPLAIILLNQSAIAKTKSTKMYVKKITKIYCSQSRDP